MICSSHPRAAATAAEQAYHLGVLHAIEAVGGQGLLAGRRERASTVVALAFFCAAPMIGMVRASNNPASYLDGATVRIMKLSGLMCGRGSGRSAVAGSKPSVSAAAR